MSLDAYAKSLLDQLSALALPKIWEAGPQTARAISRTRFFQAVMTPIGRSEDITIAGPGGPLALRLYTPVDAPSGLLPCLVFFHGGGFVLGDLETHDDLCRGLANDGRCRVVAVDYRLAPENPFPAAVEDCMAATQYVFDHAGEIGIDPERIAVGGDSAGGNLAAVVSLLARDAGRPRIRFQLLVYPVTQMGGPETPSMRENEKGYFLERKSMDWFTRCYAPDPAHRADFRLSPLMAKDLAGLPPAYVVTAGFDPLRDEGAAYAERLDRAGVPVTHAHYPGMIHGFFSMRNFIPKAKEAVAAAAAALRIGLTAE